MSISRRGFLSGLALGAGGLVASKAEAGEHLEHSYFEGHADRYGLLLDTTLCVGCRSCEAGCREVNELGTLEPPIGDQAIFETERRPTATELTVVNRYDVDGQTIFRKEQCMHCLEPSCVSVCLVSAFKKTPEGPVLYDPDACMGCRYCMNVCPYLALAYEYGSNNPRVMRCTMCYPRIIEGKNPGCADACPMGAIKFGKRKDLIALARHRFQKTPDNYVEHIFGQYEFGGTSWMLLAGTSFDNLGLASLKNASHTPLPELTKSFLSVVPLVLTMWPGLLLGFYAFTKRRDRLSDERARAAVVEALMKADEETKKKLAAAAKKAGKDRERAIAQAIKKALSEQAKKEQTEASQ